MPIVKGMWKSNLWSVWSCRAVYPFIPIWLVLGTFPFDWLWLFSDYTMPISSCHKDLIIVIACTAVSTNSHCRCCWSIKRIQEMILNTQMPLGTFVKERLVISGQLPYFTSPYTEIGNLCEIHISNSLQSSEVHCHGQYFQYTRNFTADRCYWWNRNL